MNAAYPEPEIQDGAQLHPLREEVESASICSLLVERRLYGIDTRRIREVLGYRSLERVPLAPAYIGGVLPYRGDVLTVVSFRALLGLKAALTPGCVLVLKSDEEEPFGLMVDSVGGVAMLGQDAFAANPSTLDEVGKALYSGVYRLEKGVLILLDPERLRPSRLGETGLFRGPMRRRGEVIGNESSKVEEEMRCER